MTIHRAVDADGGEALAVRFSESTLHLLDRLVGQFQNSRTQRLNHWSELRALPMRRGFRDTCLPHHALLTRSFLLWDVPAGRVVCCTQSGKGADVLDLAFDPSSSRLVSAHRDTIVEVWRLTTGEHLQTLQTRSTTFSMAIDRAGRQCALGQWEGAIELWDLDRGQRLRELAGHSRLVTALQFDDTTGRLFSASRDGTVRLWEISAAQELAELTREPAGVEGLRVTADGTTLIVGTEDGRIMRVALNQLDRYVERNASAWPR